MKIVNLLKIRNCKLKILPLMAFAFLFFVPDTSAAVLQKPPANLGLVGYWSFNEGTSTYALDYSGNGNKGTLTSMALNPSTPSSGWNPGKLGKALSFDGSDDYVGVGTNISVLQPTGNFTISGWFKTTSTNQQQIFSSYSQNANVAGIILGVNVDSGSPSKLGLLIGRNTGTIENTDWKNVDSTSNVNDGLWHFGVGVYNGTNMTVYLDGKQQTQVAWSNNPGYAATNYIRIGAESKNGSNTANFSGLIDEVRIYNRALTASEVAALYKSGAVKFKTPDNKGLVGYWSFNEGTSTYAMDYSGSGNKGTLTSMALNPSTPSSGWNPGKLGRALSFDGADDSVRVASSTSAGLNNLSAFTYAAWIKPNSRGETNAGRIINKTGSANTTGKRFQVNDGVTNAIAVIVSRATTAAVTQAAAETMKLGQWQFVATTFDGTNGAKIYMGYQNGSFGETSYSVAPVIGSGTVTDDTSSNLTIGDREDTLRAFNGLIDEVRVYNRALNADEVQKLYESGR